MASEPDEVTRADRFTALPRGETAEQHGYVMVDSDERIGAAFKAVEVALAGMTPDGQERVLRACMILRGLA
jgi:hypothetical protein